MIQLQIPRSLKATFYLSGCNIKTTTGLILDPYLIIHDCSLYMFILYYYYLHQNPWYSLFTEYFYCNNVISLHHQKYTIENKYFEIRRNITFFFCDLIIHAIHRMVKCVKHKDYKSMFQKKLFQSFYLKMCYLSFLCNSL